MIIQYDGHLMCYLMCHTWTRMDVSKNNSPKLTFFPKKLLKFSRDHGIFSSGRGDLNQISYSTIRGLTCWYVGTVWRFRGGKANKLGWTPGKGLAARGS